MEEPEKTTILNTYSGQSMGQMALGMSQLQDTLLPDSEEAIIHLQLMQDWYEGYYGKEEE